MAKNDHARSADQPIDMTFGDFAVVVDRGYRVRMPDGRLSDRVNLTRARDAARSLAERAKRAA